MTVRIRPFAYALLAATACAAAPTLAADAKQPASGFSAMDHNRDGEITADEHAAQARRMFSAMDADANGRVSAAEMDAARAKLTGGQPDASAMSSADKIKAVDGNGDGVLTAAEHATGSRRMFATMDANNNGALSRDEFDAGHAKLLKKP